MHSLGECLRLCKLLPHADCCEPSTSTTFGKEPFGEESKVVQDKIEDNACKAPCTVEFLTDEELDKDSVREFSCSLALCDKPC